MLLLVSTQWLTTKLAEDVGSLLGVC